MTDKGQSIEATPESFAETKKKAIEWIEALEYGDNLIVAAGKKSDDKGQAELQVMVACNPMITASVIVDIMEKQQLSPLHLAAVKMNQMMQQRQEAQQNGVQD